MANENRPNQQHSQNVNKQQPNQPKTENKVVAEQPKNEVTAQLAKDGVAAPTQVAPAARGQNNGRIFKIKAQPSTAPRGLQRQVCLLILLEHPKGISIEEAAKLADQKGLKTVDTTVNSVRYHFNAMVKLGWAEELTPTVVPAATETKAETVAA